MSEDIAKYRNLHRLRWPRRSPQPIKSSADGGNISSNTLSLTEQTALETLIDDSIVARYEGDLERIDEYCGVCGTYLPLDEDNIRELLTAFWGEHVTAETLDAAFDRLTQFGADEWPRAWCEEDIREEKDRRLRSIDYDIQCAEEQLANLRKEAEELLTGLKQES
jgi:hypothetical protein